MDGHRYSSKKKIVGLVFFFFLCFFTFPLPFPSPCPCTPLLLPLAFRFVVDTAQELGLFSYLSETANVVHVMAVIEMVVAMIVFVLIQFGGLVAGYGRYSSTPSCCSKGPMLSPALAWSLQEAPSFFAPLFWWWWRRGETIGVEAKILLLLLSAHYFNRTFVYPFQIRGGKPTPFSLCLLAFLFTSWNG